MKPMTFRTVILCTSLLPWAAAGTAHAQVEDTGNSDEIVVTAQKREQALQNVPISISALAGADLDRTTSGGITEALNSVPGVAATAYLQGGGTNVTIRGVSASGPVFTGSSPVSYYLDTVPFGFVKSAIAPDSSAYDLQRVEILRGPQGTLYGASALNGVVRVLTSDADLNAFSLKMRGLVSTTQYGGENFRGDAAVNLPIIPGKLAARIVVGAEEQSGWIDRPNKRDANSGRLFNLRMKINAQPTERLSIGLSAWLTRNKLDGLAVADDHRRRNSLIAEPVETNYDAFGAKLAYDLDDFSVTSSTGYMEFDNPSALDFTALGVPAALSSFFTSKIFSQELVLASNSQAGLQWTVGGSYREATDRLVQTLPVVILDTSDRSRAFAAFGELTYAISPTLDITGGLRYFHDKVSNRNNLTAAAPDRNSFDAVTPRAVLSWRPNADFAVYASYSQGFRSGALQNQGTVPAGFPALKPDRLHNYEMGTKGKLGGGILRYEAAIYYVDWTGVQQSLTVPYGPAVVTALVNAQSASGFGADLQLGINPTPGLNISLNANWNDLTIDASVVSSGAVLFAKGDRLNLSPEWTVGASANYSFGLPGDFEGELSASGNYTSSQALRTIVGTAQSIAPGDALFISRASFAVRAPEHWTITLFADNLTNESGVVYGTPFVPAGVSDWDARVRPRTFGLQLDYKF